MIFDNMDQCAKYYGVNEKFEKAFAFIKKATEENLAKGKYEIDGDELYAIIQEYTTRPKEDCLFEAHRKYIDIQYMISGTEEIQVVDISKGIVHQEYNEAGDAAMYAHTPKAGTCVIEDGEYAVFFPNDLHMPGVAFEGTPAEVRKIVVKIKL